MNAMLFVGTNPSFTVELLPDQNGSSELPAELACDFAVCRIFGHVAEGDTDTPASVRPGRSACPATSKARKRQQQSVEVFAFSKPSLNWMLAYRCLSFPLIPVQLPLMLTVFISGYMK